MSLTQGSEIRATRIAGKYTIIAACIGLAATVIGSSIAYIGGQKTMEGTLYNDIKSYTSQIAELQSDNARLKSGNDTLKSSTDELESNISNLESQLAKLQTDYKSLQKQFADSNKNNDSQISNTNSDFALDDIGTQGSDGASSAKSVILANLDTFNEQQDSSSNFVPFNENPKDNTGETHANGIGIFSNYRSNIYVEYLIDKKYSALTGIFALCYDSRSSNSEFILNVYGDNELLYTSPVLTSGTLPNSLDVDISGVKILKLEISNASTARGVCSIYDAKLS